MVGALWTGISGLSGAQRALDNESNNIANVNTLGYKASRIAFADQMYQDNIGKGVSTFDVEKLYVQGNLKVTAVGYDMALSGDGFFQVSDGNEFYYSRAGNFRMGEDGNLQNAGGYAVQGWAMAAVQDDDITSTDANSTKITNDYNKLLGNVIIRDSSSIETIVAKATDYTETARTDSIDVYTGAGYKTASTKISDVEALITEYNRQLSLHSNADPKPTATESSTQRDLLDFDLDAAGTVLDTGDEMYIFIDGTKYSQTFDTDETTTMEKLTDKISNITGFNAYMTSGTAPITASGATDPLNKNPMIDTNTTPTIGQMVIEGLVPGVSYRVTEFGWTDASAANQSIKGTVQNIVPAKEGTGMGAIESVGAVLAEMVSGKQSDVYTAADISASGADNYTLLKDSFGSGLPLNDITVSASGATPQQLADAINEHAAPAAVATETSYYLNAYVLNGNLVVEPKNSYYDKEIVSRLDDGAGGAITAKSPEHSGNRGAGGEFIQIITTINQAARKDDIQLRLDSLEITDSAFGDFSVDGSGLIIMKQDGADYAIGQVAVAKFTDNRGLDPAGNNLVKSTNRSGQAIFNLDNNKTAEIKGGVLELSTADLSESLVNLMVFQRAFEANAKSITTADQILTTLIQLKR
ncbi:MAG: flagellar hook-basal body complex protein [Campylobacterota bacterium]|nr:flagellar hook-basal body complex protein [Campylobacterota bacterium]